MHKFRQNLAHLYMVLFLVFLLAPLVVMSGAAFNDSKLPSIVPWKGFTTHWFADMIADQRMMWAFVNTLWVAVAVAVLSVIVGTASAILINSISGRVRTVLYGLMISTILIPGVVIGISTMILWTKMGNALGTEFFLFNPGLHLSVLGQVSYIAAMVMLLVLARLQSFDSGLEEAALDLGASHAQVMRRILLPHLYPAIGAGAPSPSSSRSRTSTSPSSPGRGRYPYGLCLLEGPRRDRAYDQRAGLPPHLRDAGPGRDLRDQPPPESARGSRPSGAGPPRRGTGRNDRNCLICWRPPVAAGRCVYRVTARPTGIRQTHASHTQYTRQPYLVFRVDSVR